VAAVFWGEDGKGADSDEGLEADFPFLSSDDASSTAFPWGVSGFEA
jgi:hypothetical protein